MTFRIRKSLVHGRFLLNLHVTYRQNILYDSACFLRAAACRQYHTIFYFVPNETFLFAIFACALCGVSHADGKDLGEASTSAAFLLLPVSVVLADVGRKAVFRCGVTFAAPGGDPPAWRTRIVSRFTVPFWLPGGRVRACRL